MTYTPLDLRPTKELFFCTHIPSDDSMDTTRPERSRSTYQAAQRYLRIYEEKYVIDDETKEADMRRLRNLCEASIYFLRRIAPKFYREKLPNFIDQVGSLLSSFQPGDVKVHETHGTLLMILEELRKSQPADELDFFKEKRRFEERIKQVRRYESLRKKIADLEAIEFEPGELGKDETADDKYIKVFFKLEKLREELRRTALEIAYLDGEDLEEEDLEFKLNVKPNQQLHRLSKEQLDLLEIQLADLYRRNYKKRDSLVDKSQIDEMLERLNIDTSKFKKVDLHDMAVEALEAYKSYRRIQEQERNNEYFQSLLDKEQLKPKEGIILGNPDNIPFEVKAKLEQNERTTLRQMTKIFEEYGEKPQTEDNCGAEQLDDSDDSDGLNEIIQAIKNNGKEFARVKEEPPSPIHPRSKAGSDNDDIECLGTIEPTDKIKTIDID